MKLAASVLSFIVIAISVVPSHTLHLQAMRASDTNTQLSATDVVATAAGVPNNNLALGPEYWRLTGNSVVTALEGTDDEINELDVYFKKQFFSPANFYSSFPPEYFAQVVKSQSGKKHNMCASPQFGENYSGIIIGVEVLSPSNSATDGSSLSSTAVGSNAVENSPEDFGFDVFNNPLNLELKLIVCENGKDSNKLVYIPEADPSAVKSINGKNKIGSNIPWGKRFCIQYADTSDENDEVYTADKCYVFARRQSQAYNVFAVNTPGTWVGGLFSCGTSASHDECTKENSKPLYPVVTPELTLRYNYAFQSEKGAVFEGSLFATVSEDKTKELGDQSNTASIESLSDIPSNWASFIDVGEHYVHIDKTFNRFLLDFSFKIFRKFLHYIHLLTRFPSMASVSTNDDINNESVTVNEFHRSSPCISPSDITANIPNPEYCDSPFVGALDVAQNPFDEDLKYALTLERVLELRLKTTEFLFKKISNNVAKFERQFYSVVRSQDKPVHVYSLEN